MYDRKLLTLFVFNFYFYVWHVPWSHPLSHSPLSLCLIKAKKINFPKRPLELRGHVSVLSIYCNGDQRINHSGRSVSFSLRVRVKRCIMWCVTDVLLENITCKFDSFSSGHQRPATSASIPNESNKGLSK